MEQSPSLLVSFVLPLLLAIVGVLSAVAVAAVPKLLERRQAKRGDAPAPAPTFDDDPPLDVEGRRDVIVLLDTVARLGEQLDDAEARAGRWRTRALRCERGEP